MSTLYIDLRQSTKKIYVERRHLTTLNQTEDELTVSRLQTKTIVSFDTIPKLSEINGVKRIERWNPLSYKLSNKTSMFREWYFVVLFIK